MKPILSKKILLILCAGLGCIVSNAQQAGSLDPTFGNGGKVVTSITNGQDKIYSVALQPDGKIVVAGYSTSLTTGKDFICARYNTDGTLDNTFGNTGITITDVQTGSDDVAYSLAIQNDGKIILGGYSDNGSDKNAALVRYNSDGSLDSTFGNNARAITDFESSQQDEIRVIKIHGLTGNIIIGGSTLISSSVSKPVIARYLSSGTLDNTFNSTGIRLLWITNLDYQYLFSVEDLIVQSNGKISAIGWRDFPGLQWDSDYWACRVNSDGTMDNSFSIDGVNVYNGNFNGHDKGFSMKLKPDNSFIVAGGSHLTSIYYDFAMFEITSSGDVDNFFGSADFGGLSDDIAYGFAEDNNGKFILAGSAGSLTNETFAIARFNADASIDNGFDTDGKVTTTFSNNALNEAFDVVIQPDNKIIAVGYTGNDFALARYFGESIPQLDSFQLVSPANQSVSQNYSSLAFNWTDAFGAVSYEFEIDSSVNFDLSPQTYTTSVSSKNLSNLQPSTDYFWHVKASDGTNSGQWNETWEFTTSALINNFVNNFEDVGVSLFPNPAKDKIVIKSPFLLDGELSIRDISGRLVFSKNISNETNLNISTEILSNGTYFIFIYVNHSVFVGRLAILK